MSIETCNHVFGRIADGRILEAKTFDGINSGGVFTLIAQQEATPGHSLVLPVECQDEMDMLSAQTLRNMGIVARATGIWLKAAFQPRRIARLVDGEGIQPAHEHIIPKYTPRDYLRVLGAADPQPFVDLDKEQQSAIVAQATLPDQYAEMVRQELTGEAILPQEYFT